ncbi:MAG: hypothetical protein L0Y73_01385 [Candidatus Aminicenantes bacterium]|nr:hypothetical protein [Candidatus Aminicenantes bacterium]
MKKRLLLWTAAMLILICEAFFAAAEVKTAVKKEAQQKKKATVYVLCSQITRESLKGVKASKKKTANGVVIVMTSPKPEVVKKLKGIISSCRTAAKPAANPEANPGVDKKEILNMAGVVVKEIKLNNGIRIEITSVDRKTIERIRRVRLPGYLKVRSKKDRDKM